jgi:hypothetical protein
VKRGLNRVSNQTLLAYHIMFLKGLAAVMLKPLLLNPARPGGSTRWLDRFGFNKRPAVATARPNLGDPGEPGRDPVFFFFSKMEFETH